MKKLLSLLLCTVLLAGLLAGTVSAAEQVTINVYNWGQYISDGTDDCIDVIAEF